MDKIFNFLDTDKIEIALYETADDIKELWAFFETSEQITLGEGLEQCADVCDGVMPKMAEVKKYEYRLIVDDSPTPWEQEKGVVYCQFAHNQSDERYVELYRDEASKALYIVSIHGLNSYGFYALLLWLKQQKLLSFRKYPHLSRLLKRVI